MVSQGLQVFGLIYASVSVWEELERKIPRRVSNAANPVAPPSSPLPCQVTAGVPALSSPFPSIPIRVPP